MKLISKIGLSALLLVALASCQKGIMSDLSECPQYTIFTFDVRTPDEISYPDGKIDDLRVFAFDENDQLIGEWKECGFLKKVDSVNVTLLLILLYVDFLAFSPVRG
ncbi:hypothetical protein [Porphyromonas somerae]|uniref:hypothetical protein n=1 Tax=Porphyromonas somerae TaxID=322095 RepID=UPI001FCC8666|nr:hypothetical protein [Porphyromonas somerae]BDE83009.1 hypothetical protein CE91St14_20370 [Porphyromonas somerae]